jgi:hypothetical protein
MLELKRMWVNQPSGLQPYHGLHGKRVLYHKAEERIWFIDGPIENMLIKPEALSHGWPERLSASDFLKT